MKSLQIMTYSDLAMAVVVLCLAGAVIGYTIAEVGKWLARRRK